MQLPPNNHIHIIWHVVKLLNLCLPFYPIIPEQLFYMDEYLSHFKKLIFLSKNDTPQYSVM